MDKNLLDMYRADAGDGTDRTALYRAFSTTLLVASADGLTDAELGRLARKLLAEQDRIITRYLEGLGSSTGCGGDHSKRPDDI